MRIGRWKYRFRKDCVSSALSTCHFSGAVTWTIHLGIRAFLAACRIKLRSHIVDLSATATAERAATGFMVASGGVLFDGYGHGGPGVCLGDGQTESYLNDMRLVRLASDWAMARKSTVARWTRRRVAPSYALTADLRQH